MPNELKFTLRQYTPIIHFQSDQPGATLRATEVKPKLDRFIWERVWKNNFELGKKFLVGYHGSNQADLKKKFDEDKYRALDYKIKITTNDNDNKTELIKKPKLDNNGNQTMKNGKLEWIPFPLFFADLDNQEDVKKFRFNVGDIEFRIWSMHSELINFLEGQIISFFNLHNFGTRQSKGFGSFGVYMNSVSYEGLANKYFYFSITNTANDRAKRSLFNSIDLFYRTLRAGIHKRNRNGSTLYFKSLLYQYAQSKYHTWDKKAVKANFFYQDNIPENWPPFLYRDLLGLSSSESWLSYNRTTITKSHANIDRYKSPITFKPILDGNQFRVYIIDEEVDNNMLNQEFTISNSNPNRSFTLATPAEFNLRDYLEFAIQFIADKDAGVESYAEYAHTENENIKLLDRIYEQLNEQL